MSALDAARLLRWAMLHRARAVDLLSRGKAREAVNNDEIADDYERLAGLLLRG